MFQDQWEKAVRGINYLKVKTMAVIKFKQIAKGISKVVTDFPQDVKTVANIATKVYPKKFGIGGSDTPDMPTKVAKKKY